VIAPVAETPHTASSASARQHRSGERAATFGEQLAEVGVGGDHDSSALDGADHHLAVGRTQQTEIVDMDGVVASHCEALGNQG
jgi:hypothetical protein